MDRKTKGRLAETKVITYLIEEGYETYIPFSNNCQYDIVAVKDGNLNRISVKFTSSKRQSGSWSVEMRQIYRGNNKIIINKFDSSKFDLVAVYIGPKDKVVLVKSSEVKTRSLHIKD